MASKKTAKNETTTEAKLGPKKAAKRAAASKTPRKRAPYPAKAMAGATTKTTTKAARKKPVHTTPDAVKQELAKSGGPVSISVLANALGVTIPTAKRHLKALGAAVKSEGTTRDRVYSLAAA